MEFMSEAELHKSYLFKYLNKKNPNGRIEDFEDAIQACFIKAFKYKDSFKGNCSLKSWLTLIVGNCYTDIFRTKYNQHETLNYHEENFIFENIPEGDFAENICNEDYFKGLVKDLFFDLNDNVCMQTFKLNTLEDLAYSEISIRLDIPLGTVKSRIFKARKLLQERYNQNLERNQI
jgi:RNA polymerase sigma-70 factor (ECF subfamily)